MAVMNFVLPLKYWMNMRRYWSVWQAQSFQNWLSMYYPDDLTFFTISLLYSQGFRPVGVVLRHNARRNNYGKEKEIQDKRIL